MTSAPTLDLRYTAERTLRVSDDVELYYEIQGEEGPHLTLVNNFFIIAPMWRNFTAELAKRNRVLTYDLRNQGASSVCPDMTWDDHVEDLRALLDGLGIERTHLVGTSASGFICRDFAARYPERVDGLILTGPSCTPSDGIRRRATERACINSLELGGTQALWDHLYSVVFSEAAMREMGAPGYLGLRSAFTAIHPPDPMLTNLRCATQVVDGPEELARIKQPTLLLLGDKDEMWNEAYAEEAGRLIEDSEVVWLRDVGHLPYMEDGDGFQARVQRFLDELAAREATVAPQTGAAPSGPGTPGATSATGGDAAPAPSDGDDDPLLAELCALLREVVADRADLPATGLAETPLNSIGLESWAFTLLLGRIEERLSVEWDMDVPPDVFESLRTIADHLRADHDPVLTTATQETAP
ncbi:MULTISPECIES: alpha/beta fold hydrolase [unclassified Streptomyces]|uniref:alpha/beta fold hydrolase n=1 Tax=unclassified Streptomyces TaxID=2593676 RepID=UPI0022B605BD|nr:MULTISPECIES: alpha/beta fold hydrolase [unclassified Streptomyces]MCZ7417810.1 alpha/beta fold hydrolase [Streptomyces sp. WMMC897]MCZ7432385.1 alpha/beta fold hydrolase [Streptomyces sp. WMMC1477]